MVVLLTFLLASMMAIVCSFINFSIGLHDGDRVVVLFSNFSIGYHDGDRVVVLLTFLLASMKAIVW